jgi:hypothetical protein
MKKYVLIIGLLLLFVGNLTAQQHQHRWGMRHQDKIEELKKMKMIEELNLDEETSVRFFARRNKHKEKMKQLMNMRDSILSEIDKKLNSDANQEAFDVLINSINKTEQKINQERRDFFQSLDDILDEKQIAKLILFEHEFHQKLRDLIFKRRGMGPPQRQKPGF